MIVLALTSALATKRNSATPSVAVALAEYSVPSMLTVKVVFVWLIRRITTGASAGRIASPEANALWIVMLVPLVESLPLVRVTVPFEVIESVSAASVRATTRLS